MGKRREGREAAVQFLFQHDLHRGEFDDESLDRLLERFWQLRPAAAVARDFGSALVKGVLENKEPIDERIRKHATNYELNRIAAVDRNILRVAVYEMVFSDDVPPVVCINEAIEIAKRFGSEDSGGFVNGILDRIKGEVARPER